MHRRYAMHACADACLLVATTAPLLLAWLGAQHPAICVMQVDVCPSAVHCSTHVQEQDCCLAAAPPASLMPDRCCAGTTLMSAPCLDAPPGAVGVACSCMLLQLALLHTCCHRHVAKRQQRMPSCMWRRQAPAACAPLCTRPLHSCCLLAGCSTSRAAPFTCTHGSYT